MRHARIELWSRGASSVHRRHPSAKILVALTFLVAIASINQRTWPLFLLYLALLAGGVVTARLPLLSVLRSAAVVLPFAIVFGAVAALGGDTLRGELLIPRSYLSSLTVLLLAGTTSMPELLAGLEILKAPRFLLQVMQFLYRYLIVLVEEASAMRDASLCRAGSLRRLRFRQAAGAAAVLFARSYSRAQAIHNAMISRGFIGTLPRFSRAAFSYADGLFAAGSGLVILAFRLSLR